MSPRIAERATSNMQGQLRALMICFTLLAAFFVGLRVISRAARGIKIGLDDWLLIIGQFFLFALMTSGLLMIHWGLGLPATELSGPALVHMGKTLIAFECLYVTAVAFVKVSLVVMFSRLFPIRTVRLGSWILGGVAVSWAISIVCVCIFQCTPVAKAWNPTLPGHCINLRGSFIGNAIPNILTDVLILSLPIPQVWGLHTTLAQRISLCVVFLLGSFVVFTSIYRFTTLFAFVQTDVSWTLAIPCAWTVVETSSGVISACLPTLGPLFQSVGLRLGLTTEKSRSHTQPVDLVTIGGGGKRSKMSNKDNTFGRLSDDSLDMQLRPNEGYHQTHSVSRSKTPGSSDGSGDEVPFNKITKRVEVQWQESRMSA